MKSRFSTILFLVVLTLAGSSGNLNGQETRSKPSRQSSFEAFSKGNFEQAYSEFSQLLQVYPKDPLYNYYSGVCLIKLNRDPDQAVTFLNQALQGSGELKSLPPDADFYLGRALQISGRFDEAIGSYNRFTEKAGKKMAKEYGTAELIAQCNEKKGAVSRVEIKPEEAAVSIPELKDTKSDTLMKEVVAENVRTEPEAKAAVAVAAPVREEPVTMETVPQPNLPANYDKLMDQALEYQYYADSLTALATRQKKELEKLPENQKASMRTKIGQTEKSAQDFQKKADQKFTEANATLKPSALTSEKPAAPKQNETKAAVEPAKTAVAVQATIPEKQAETAMPVPASTTPKGAGVLSYFEVLPKPADPSGKVTIDPEVPEGLVYRIQIGVFRNPVSPSYFNGLSPVYGFRVPGTDRTVYYIGMFRRSAEAGKALATVRAKGFKDAFIVPLAGTKSLSAERAVSMEKEWANKPFEKVATQKQQTSADTIPPTLVFRVEIVRSAKPLKADVAESVKKAAGNRPLEVRPLQNGEISYIAGKFITFESASEYSELLVKNGYKDAKVVSFLGEKEIPVENAKKLMENVK